MLYMVFYKPGEVKTINARKKCVNVDVIGIGIITQNRNAVAINNF